MGIKDSNNETYLINKIKQGDTNAFRPLVEKYKDVSLSLAYSILKNQELAEDVLQDAFIKVFEKINTFKFKSNFSTWLYRIVVNTSYTALKRQKPTADLNDIADTIEVTADGNEIIDTEIQKKYINLALLRIKADEALALELFYLCELSINEIIEITGFGKSKVKIDLHRGRENLEFQLRKLLGNEINSLL